MKTPPMLRFRVRLFAVIVGLALAAAVPRAQAAPHTLVIEEFSSTVLTVEFDGVGVPVLSGGPDAWKFDPTGLLSILPLPPESLILTPEPGEPLLNQVSFVPGDSVHILSDIPAPSPSFFPHFILVAPDSVPTPLPPWIVGLDGAPVIFTFIDHGDAHLPDAGSSFLWLVLPALGLLGFKRALAMQARPSTLAVRVLR